MADRDRDMAELRLDVTLHERVSFGLAADVARDNYRKSVIGLLDARDSAIIADASFVLAEETSATLYLNHEQIKSTQANAELLAPLPTWFAGNNDTVDTGGVGVKHRISDKIDIGVDYTIARSISEIAIRGTPAFPDLLSRLDTVKINCTYQLRKKLALHLTYWYENFSSEDWAVDGVTPTTLANVINLGRTAPAYHIHVAALSARYEF